MSIRRNSPQDPLEITGYVTAFIDILGLAHELKQLDLMFNDGGRESDVVASARKSLGAILKMRRSVEDFFYAFEKTPIPPRELAPDEQAIWDRSFSTKVVVQYLSDSVVLSTRIHDGNLNGSWIGILRLVRACASASTHLLSLGHPCRGGIELGSGCEVSPGEVIGGALASAHFLESRVSVVPRIIVGERLMEMLRKCLDGPAANHSLLERRFARRMIEMTCTDTDGRQMIDFLSPKVLGALERDVAHECASRIRAVIHSGFFDAVRRGDAGLIKKYSWLHEYARTRLLL